MHGKAIICIQPVSAAFHIGSIHGRPEFSVSSPDKNIAQECLDPVFSEQIHADCISAHIHLFHVKVQPALSVSGFQLYKAYVFSFFFPLIFINI